MPDNNSPAAKPTPSVEPGEFDFVHSAEENPRIKRRSLKPRKEASLKPTDEIPAAVRELAREAPPLSTEAAKSKFTPQSQDEDDVEINAAEKSTEPSPTRPASASQPLPNHPPRTTPTSTTSPHGTRPATLYYSTGIRKDKEDTSPMKTTTTSAPTQTTSTVPSSPARSVPTSTRPSSVVDYRANVERQSREQKSVGNVLSILVYTLIAFFVVGASLSGYGAWVLSKQIHQQSVTVDDLDKRQSDRSQALEDQLKSTLATLTEAQAQIGRQQDLILKQQEAINRLIAANTDNASAIKQEKLARTQETSSIRTRLKDLEYQGPTTRKY